VTGGVTAPQAVTATVVRSPRARAVRAGVLVGIVLLVMFGLGEDDEREEDNREAWLPGPRTLPLAAETDVAGRRDRTSRAAQCRPARRL